jgi:hypothetical protein
MLAASCAPPKSSRGGQIVFAGLFILLFVAAIRALGDSNFSAFAIGAGLSSLPAAAAILLYRMDVNAMAAWKRKIVCMRCGSISLLPPSD